MKASEWHETIEGHVRYLKNYPIKNYVVCCVEEFEGYCQAHVIALRRGSPWSCRSYIGKTLDSAKAWCDQQLEENGVELL